MPAAKRTKSTARRLPAVGVGNGHLDEVQLGESGPSRDFYGGLNIGFLIAFAYRALLDQQHTLLARRGIRDIRPAHGYVLLAVQDSGATLTDLVNQTQLSKQALSPIVVELEQRGLVHRQADPEDGRRIRISLTKRGETVLERAASAWEDIEEGMVDLVGREAVDQLRDTFVTYLSVYARIEERRRPKPRPVW
jgi:DNA-binding MarR family transcriptional regulator